MRVRVDEAGRQDEAFGVEGLARGRRVGVEARAAWSLSRFVDVSADVTAVDARLLPATDKGPGQWALGGDAVPGVPNLSGTLRGALTPFDGVRLGVSSQAPPKPQNPKTPDEFKRAVLGPPQQ